MVQSKKEDYPKHIPIHLKFQNLTVKAEEKVILENVSGEFLPGELVAIMGPSGSFIFLSVRAYM